MNRSVRRSFLATVRFVVGLTALGAFAVVAFGQAPKGDFPNRSIRYVAASAPGGASDIIARILGPALSENLGVPAVIDNRPGAGNTIGAEIAAKAVPDGYTVFGCNIASLAVSPALYKKLGYDPVHDFAPIGMIASNPNMLTVHPSIAATTVGEFISLVKSRPGKLNYASAGVGTSPQLSMELFRMQAGLDIVHIPYKGVGPALVDLIGGRVDAMFSTVPSALAAVRQGKIKALAVTSLKRDSDVPDIPTIAESGMPDFEVISWQGLCTQSKVPHTHFARIRDALAVALDLPDTRKRLSDSGFQPHTLPADKFAAWIRSERAKWAKVVKAIGIPPQ